MSNKDTLQRMLNDFYPYAKEYMEFDRDAKIRFIADSKNADNALGKTAYYDPSNYSVTVYTSGRHPKDIMRSVSHELVHHTQNCRGDFSNAGETNEGYAQNDEHLREMERQAYEIGNLCFRDWEDGVKANPQNTTIYEHTDFIRSSPKMKTNSVKSLMENFKSFLTEGGLKEGDKVKDLRNDTIGTVVEPMAGGAVIELEDGTIVKTRDKFLEKVEGEPMQEGGTMGEYGKMDAEQGLPPTKIGRGNEEYMAAYNAVLQARGEEPLDIQKPDDDYLDALRSGRLEERAWAEDDLTSDQWDALRDIKATGQTTDSNAFRQLARMGLADARHLGGGQYEFTISKNAEQALADLDSDAGEAPAIDRGYMEEPEDGFGSPTHYQESVEPSEVEESFRSSDEEKEMMAKMSNKELYKYLTHDKFTVPNLKGDMGPIDGMEGPFQYRSGAVLYYDPKVGRYYDRGKDMYLDNEEALELTMESDSAGAVDSAKEKGMKNDVQRVAKFMFHHKQLGAALEKVKGDTAKSAQLLALIASELGVEPEDLGRLTTKAKVSMTEKESINTENDTMESNNTTSLREKVKTAVMSKLSEMFDDDDMYGDDEMYGDDDEYMSNLEKEFPFLKGGPNVSVPDSGEDAAMAAAAADAAASGEFQSDEEEEEMEEPTVMNETYDDEVYDKADKVVDALGYADTLDNLYKAMDTREFLGNLEYISRMNDIDIPEDAEDDRWNVYDMVREAMGDEQFLQATLQAMSTEDATQTLDFIMTNYGIGEGDEDMYETTLRDRVMKRVQEIINQKTETIVDEASTKKYDDSEKLKGDQDELPDELQKNIIASKGDDEDKEEMKEGKCPHCDGDAPKSECTCGKMNEYGDHETQASGGLVRSSYSADPEMDNIVDLSRDVVAGGGELMQIATMLKGEGYDVTFKMGVLMVDSGTGKYFIGKPEKFDIGPNEPVQEVGSYVVGSMGGQMEETIAANPEDFYNKMRNESRIVAREEWNNNIRSQRSSLLNERLMKSWFKK